MMDIENYITQKKKLIDRALDRFLPSVKAKPQVIHRAMRYAVFSGGKRIRPIFTIASFEVCGGGAKSILPVACAIELIHTYTLIHDDLPCMDNDDYRRGKLSCHKKFGEDIALLAGDALLTLSFQLLSEAERLEVVREVSGRVGTYGTIGGQVVDVKRHSARRIAHRVELDYIASHKTGALFEVAVKVAGVFKKVSKQKIDALANFGKDIGFSFQLTDDLIDGDGFVKVFGRSETEKKAAFLIGRAKSHLKIFGNRTGQLLELADLILDRIE